MEILAIISFFHFNDFHPQPIGLPPLMTVHGSDPWLDHPDRHSFQAGHPHDG